MDPSNQQNVIVAHGEARTSTCGVQFSTNSGLSWTEGASPVPKDGAACVRNTNGPLVDLAFTPDGILLAACAGYPNANDFHSKIYVARLSDLGRTFTATAVPGLVRPIRTTCSARRRCRRSRSTRPTRNECTWPIRPTMDRSPWPDRFSRPESSPPVTRSGRTWLGPTTEGRPSPSPWPSPTTPKDHASRAYLAVGKAGELYVFAGEVNTPVPFGSTNPPAGPRIFLSTSTDGGKPSPQKVIHTSAAGRPGDEYAVLLAISSAIDPKTGDVYLTWEDTGRRPPEILFSRSADKGATWSEPMKVNDAAPGRQWD